MRRAAATTATAALALATSIGFASPASADHVIELLDPNGRCLVGNETNPTGALLATTDFKIQRYKNGLTKRITCRFDDVPLYTPAEETLWGEAWVMPKGGVRYVDTCWGPDYGEFPEDDSKLGDAVVHIKPNGTATMTCVFPQHKP